MDVFVRMQDIIEIGMHIATNRKNWSIFCLNFIARSFDFISYKFDFFNSCWNGYFEYVHVINWLARFLTLFLVQRNLL